MVTRSTPKAVIPGTFAASRQLARQAGKKNLTIDGHPWYQIVPLGLQTGVAGFYRPVKILGRQS